MDTTANDLIEDLRRELQEAVERAETAEDALANLRAEVEEVLAHA